MKKNKNVLFAIHERKKRNNQIVAHDFAARITASQNSLIYVSVHR